MNVSPLPVNTSARTYAVKPGKANIYVYRNESMGGAVKMPVLLNGRAVGDTASKTFLLLEVEMGIIAARSQLQLVDEAKGKAGVAECKLAQPVQH